MTSNDSGMRRMPGSMISRSLSASLSLVLVACGCGSSTPKQKSAGEAAPIATPASAPGVTAAASTSATALAAATASAAAPKSGPTSPTVASKCPGVKLELKNVRWTNGVLEVDAYLRNDGKQSYALMLTGDGSSSGDRSAYFEATFDPPEVKTPDRCGMMNRLTDQDFITLAPGVVKKLEFIHVSRPAHAGTYKLSATYTNDPSFELNSNLDAPGMVAKVRKTVPCLATSNVVTITAP